LSLDPGAQAAVVGTGLLLFVGFCGGVFRASSVRGETSRKWDERVGLARSALSLLTLAELRELRTEINRLIPKTDIFDPLEVVADPAPLRSRIERTAEYYDARVRMQESFERAPTLGRAFVAGLALLALATVPLTIHFAQLVHTTWLAWVGAGLLGLGCVVLFPAAILYIICEDRLSSGEILARTGNMTATEDGA
jgi:hypothetical protein